MFEALLRNLIPMMLLRVGNVSKKDKRLYAEYLKELVTVYLNDDRRSFELLLTKLSLPGVWDGSITEALWRDNTSERTGAIGGENRIG